MLQFRKLLACEMNLSWKLYELGSQWKIGVIRDSSFLLLLMLDIQETSFGEIKAGRFPRGPSRC